MLLAAALVVLLVILLRTPKAGPSGMVRDTARAGRATGKQDGGRDHRRAQPVVDEGMFNISINTTPTFTNGKAEGPLQIENVPGNQYLMQVQITLDDTGELIYQTGLIEPNHHTSRLSSTWSWKRANISRPRSSTPTPSKRRSTSVRRAPK